MTDSAPPTSAHSAAQPSRGRTALLGVFGLLLFLAGGMVGYQLRFHSDLANTPAVPRSGARQAGSNPKKDPRVPSGSVMAAGSRPVPSNAGGSPDAAEQAWQQAEALFAAKKYVAAQGAYREFDQRFPTSRIHEINAITLKERFAALEEELNPKPRPGLIGWYFSGQEFQDGDLLLERIDATVDFGWGGEGPAPGVAADHFCVRWTGQLTVKQPGRYVLATVTDDGARLKVDGKVVIEQWVDQADTRVAAEVDLTAGAHELVFEMYENGGAATARLFWALPNGFDERIIPTEALSHDPKLLKRPPIRQEPAPPTPPAGDGPQPDEHF